jgi:hypothetical protein
LIFIYTDCFALFVQMPEAENMRPWLRLYCCLCGIIHDCYIVLNTVNIVSIFFSEQNSVVQVSSSVTLSTTVSERFVQFFHQVFLPQGYPNSVSDDYCRYQLWDTLQVSSLLMWYMNRLAA